VLGIADSVVEVASRRRWWHWLSEWRLALYPTRTTAAPAAYGVEDLLAIMAQGAEEHPPRKAVEAAPVLLAALVFLVGRGVLRALR
jgi:hypothetical protein